MNESYKLEITILALTGITINPPGDKAGGPQKLPRAWRVDLSGPRHVPIIPASTIRGAFRHGAAAHLCKDRKVSRDEWLSLAIGGTKGSETREDRDPHARETVRRENPMAALYGLGASPVGMIPGGLGFTHAYPIEPFDSQKISVVEGVRRDPFMSPLFVQYVTDEDTAGARMISELNGQRSKLRSEMKRAKGEARDSLKLEMDAIDEKIKEVAGTDAVLGRPLDGYEAFAKGQEFVSDGHISGVGPEHVELFLEGVRHWATTAVGWRPPATLGGHVAHGFGRTAGMVSIDGRPMLSWGGYGSEEKLAA